MLPDRHASPFIARLLPLLRRAVLLLLTLPTLTEAQEQRTVVNGYGHLEQTVQRTSGTTDAFFSMGEHSVFVTSVLNSRFSYLGELSVRFNAASASGYVASIERSLVRYQLNDRNSIIAGKVHTPVNYWNDVYHHGRVFFPVIDRPVAFSTVVPLHTLGIQLQGQNIGTAKFGYDVMAGNHISSTDVFQPGVSPALLAAIHVKPRAGMRVGASLYYDVMETNGYGAHAGHSIGAAVPAEERYTGRMTYGLASTSVAYFGPRVELLHEFSYNWTNTDTLGTARNVASFLYAGIRLGASTVPYVLVDGLRVADNDLHTYPLRAEKQAIGVRWEFTPTVVLKVQFERSRLDQMPSAHTMGAHMMGAHMMGHAHATPFTHALRLQLAYGVQ
jgi:hypothetical protein